MFIKPLVPHRSIESFNAGILLWLRGLDKDELDAFVVRPISKLITDGFRTVVRANVFWFASPFDDWVKRSDDPRGRQ